MAATRLIPLHVNKGRSVAACLEARTDYAKNPEKTEKGDLVTSYECDPMTVDEEFMLSKRKYQQITGLSPKNDIIAYQIRQSFRPGEITAEEAKSLYQGFEVAAHTCTHQDLSRCPADVRRREIEDDVAALSWLFRREIAGFAYPYGKGADESRNVLREAGVRYARTVDPAPDFRFPNDPLRLPITCRQSDPRFFSRLEDFFRSEAEEDQLFLAFAHSYEFDFGDKHSSWERFRRICEIVARQPGLKCCSIREALESQTA